MSAITDRLDALKSRLDAFAQNVGIHQKRAMAQRCEDRMADAGFWSDQDAAQTIINELKAAKLVLDPYDQFSQGVTDTYELAELATSDAEQADIQIEVENLEKALSKLELGLVLSGPYDNCNVYMNIQSGVGGTDANDWAQMLFRMYSGYCQSAGYSMEVLDMLPAEDAGLKSCTLYIKGPMVYGHLKSEMGTHRLVRMSPFNAQGKRQTSFAAVEITPEIADAKIVNMEDLNAKEFRIDTYRASGSGGQHVNKTDSAVRITHLPSGMTVSCQSERSQPQNKSIAWKMMCAKLQQMKDGERLAELKELQGERGMIGWGHQIRSYFIHPTQMIKDLRTGYEENNADKVLAGNIQGYIDSYLQYRLAQLAQKQQKFYATASSTFDTRRTSSGVVVPSKILRTPSMARVFMPLATAALRMSAVVPPSKARFLIWLFISISSKMPMRPLYPESPQRSQPRPFLRVRPSIICEVMPRAFRWRGSGVNGMAQLEQLVRMRRWATTA